MSLNLPKKLHNFFPPKGANRAYGLWRSLGVGVQFGPSKSEHKLPFTRPLSGFSQVLLV
jgi:hypothetical protein